MAVKINLLPGYVRLEKVRLRVALASLISLGVIAAVLVTGLHYQRLQLETAEIDRDNFQRVADESTAARTKADNFVTQRAAIDGTVDWLVAASKSGPERAALLNLLRQYIYESSLVKTIDISDGQTVKIGGTVRDPNEYARFLLNLRQASDAKGGPLFAGLPTASGPQGFGNGAVPFVPPSPNPSGQPVVITYPIAFAAQGTLRTPIPIPSDPTTATAAAPAEGAPPEGAPPEAAE